MSLYIYFSWQIYTQSYTPFSYEKKYFLSFPSIYVYLEILIYQSKKKTQKKKKKKKKKKQQKKTKKKKKNGPFIYILV